MDGLLLADVLPNQGVAMPLTIKSGAKCLDCFFRWEYSFELSLLPTRLLLFIGSQNFQIVLGQVLEPIEE